MCNGSWFTVLCLDESMYYYVSYPMLIAPEAHSDSVQDKAIKVAIFNSGIEFQVGHSI